MNNTTVSKISLLYCDFDEASSLLLSSLFPSKLSLDSLAIGACFTSVEHSVRVLVGNLAGSSRGLKMLDLRSHSAWENDGKAFNAVVDALSQTTSAVESIRFDFLSPSLCNYRIARLPTFRSLREIGFSLDDATSR